MNFYIAIFLIALLVATGVYFTIRTKFVQFRMLPEGIRLLKEKSHHDDGVSSFQALMISTASRVGTGNIAGVATALAAGGAGSIFWMWIIALIGGASAFIESTLAQVYKEKDGDSFRGGPAYYIEKAIGKRWLGIIFSCLLIACFIFGFNPLQAYNVSSAVEYYFSNNELVAFVIGAVLALATAAVIFGGVHRIGIISSKVVPVMAILYILAGLIVIFMNAEQILPAFKMIFIGAFKPQAVAGGMFGIGIKEAMRFGIARGLMSNEAGTGSTPHAHAVAKVKHPCDQGLVAFMSVFIDTFIILNITVFIILTSGTYTSGQDGIVLTQLAFDNAFGSVGGIIISICIFFFSFSTILAAYFYGESNVLKLFGRKAMPVYTALIAAFVVIGSGFTVSLVWSICDVFNGFMVFINIIGLWGISNVIVKLWKEYERDPNVETTLKDIKGEKTSGSSKSM